MKEKEGVLSMSELKIVDKVRGGFHVDGHVNVTQLSRSTEWKEMLKEMDSMQILDRNKTAGVLMSKDAYVAVMKYIDALEDELDSSQVAALVSARQHMNWTEGDDLAEKAEESFLKRSKHLQRIIDDAKQ